MELKDKSMCVGCGACVQSCSLNCISLQMDEEGFYYPSVITERCIECGKCERVCPSINSLNNSSNGIKDVWCVKNIDNEIRFNSSSGGVFSAIAEYIISENGVIFGVSMSDDCKSAEHIAVQSLEDLKRLRGSKYLQSNMGNAYLLAKEYLQQGRKVLFSGTPCQIKGLKLYLNKEFENLICLEVICHGVTSQKLWAKYVDFLQIKLKAKISNVSFRSKKYGWKDLSTKYSAKDKYQYFKFNFEDPYFRMFNSNFCLRQSCYYCLSKDGLSGADITLGDFWNIETIYPQICDNKGISMVLLNSNKGKELFEKTKNSFFSTNENLNYEMAKRCNPAIYKSQPYSVCRDKFYDDVNNLSFEELSKKYTPKTIKIIIKSALMKTGLWTYIRKTGHIIPNYGMLFIYKK